MYQGAIPEILENTKKDFFLKIVNLLREAVDKCYDRIQQNPYITCPMKPEGSMFVMVRSIAQQLHFFFLEKMKEMIIKFKNFIAGETEFVTIGGHQG